MMSYFLNASNLFHYARIVMLIIVITDNVFMHMIIQIIQQHQYLVDPPTSWVVVLPQLSLCFPTLQF